MTLSGQGLDRLRTAMARHATEGGVPAIAWAVAHDGEVHTGTAGVAAEDTVFRLSSMTKPVTAVAAMCLVEDGTLRLDDPVDDLLPELADRRVVRDPDGGDLDDTVPAHRPITLRDLLTFRMGLGMDFARWGRQPVFDAMAAKGVAVGPPAPQQGPDADGFLAALGELPLEFQPGERWLYHTGADVLGVLLARAEGASLGEVLRRRVFEPLAMHDTGFVADAARLTDCVTADGDVYDPADGQWARPAVFESGGAGLVSTVPDYLAFTTGLREHRLLSPPSVGLLTTDHLTDEQRAVSSPDGEGAVGWGFGLSVRARQTDGEHVGTYGWSGGLGSLWAYDPVADLDVVLLTDRMFASPVAPAVCQDLLGAAHAAVER